MLVLDHQVEVRWDDFLAKADYTRVRHVDLRWVKGWIRWLRTREFDAF